LVHPFQPTIVPHRQRQLEITCAASGSDSLNHLTAP
jgi:hypothetical protein